MAAAGASVSGMARALGLDRKTVRVWLRRDGQPLWQRCRSVPTVLDPHHSYLEQRWREGCRNAAELARELIRRGANVRPRVVRDRAMKRRRASIDALDASPGSATTRWRPLSIDRTMRLLQADPSTLDDGDRRFLDGLREEAPALTDSAALAAQFANMLRRRSSKRLEAWFEAAAATPLAKFALGLRRDVEAVRGTATMPW